MDKKKERKKGVDPPDHPRVKGSRQARALIGIPYHHHGNELYVGTSTLATRVCSPQGHSFDVVK